MAHSSAVAVTVAGEPRFEAAVARGLALEMDWNRREILRRAVFADASERSAVLDVYEEATRELEARLPFFDRVRSILTRWYRSLRDFLTRQF